MLRSGISTACVLSRRAGQISVDLPHSLGLMRWSARSSSRKRYTSQETAPRIARIFALLRITREGKIRCMKRARSSVLARYVSLPSLLVASTFLSLTAIADSNEEYAALARLIHEIEALEPVIATAESQASPDARIRFRYDWLRQDLERIRAGVQEHIDAPRNEPRKVPPLRGDYRQ